MRKIKHRMMIAFLGGAIIATAQPGSLDTSFGGTGTVATQFPGYGECKARAIAIDGEGRIVVAGYAKHNTSGHNDFALARYLPDGSLDPTFGVGGRVTTNVIGDDDYATGVAIARSGHIIVGGYAMNDGDFDFVAVRYLPNGMLDASFGYGGVAFFYKAGNDIATGMVIDYSNRIIVAGYHAPVSGDKDFAAVRFLPTGMHDPSFAPSGYVLFKLTDYDDYAYGVAVDSFNRVILAGYTAIPTSTYFWHVAKVLRCLENGEHDLSFGNLGVFQLAWNNRTRAYAVSIQPDKKIVVGGSFDVNNADNSAAFLAFRLNNTGQLDTGFGAPSNLVVTDFYNWEDEALSVGIYPSNTGMVLGGYATPSLGPVGTLPNLALTCHQSNGALNPSFGAAGKVELDVGGGDDKIHAVALDSRGYIVTTGYTRPVTAPPVPPRFLTARFCACYEPVGVQELQNRQQSWNIFIMPNPATGSEVRLSYYLPQADAVQIRLIHAGGGQIALLASGQRPAGAGEEMLRIPDALPSGVYIVQLTTASQGAAHIRLVWMQ